VWRRSRAVVARVGCRASIWPSFSNPDSASDADETNFPSNNFSAASLKVTAAIRTPSELMSFPRLFTTPIAKSYAKQTDAETSDPGGQLSAMSLTEQTVSPIELDRSNTNTMSAIKRLHSCVVCVVVAVVVPLLLAEVVAVVVCVVSR
jgi:hypothetical protein